MNVIKVNYNNAAVKIPKKLVPTAFCYKYERVVDGVHENVIVVEIDPKLNEESFYKKFLFEVLINGDVMSYSSENIQKNSQGRYYIEIVNCEHMNSNIITVKVKGKYYSDNGIEYDIETDLPSIRGCLVCSDDLYCNENLLCNECTGGYFNDGVFYSVRTGTPGAYEYSEPADHSDPNCFNGIFIDKDTGICYKWDSESNSYVLFYN